MLVLRPDDLLLMIDPSTFVLRVLYMLFNCVYLFSLVIAFERKHIPSPGGSYGRAGTLLPSDLDGPYLKGISGG